MAIYANKYAMIFTIIHALVMDYCIYALKQ